MAPYNPDEHGLSGHPGFTDRLFLRTTVRVACATAHLVAL